jgi:hypothetical protein
MNATTASYAAWNNLPVMVIGDTEPVTAKGYERKGRQVWIQVQRTGETSRTWIDAAYVYEI